MENIYYLFYVLAAILGFCAHYFILREEPNKIQHEFVDESLKAINAKLDNIIEKLSEQKVEVGVLRTNVDNLTERVSKLESWFGELLHISQLHTKQ